MRGFWRLAAAAEQQARKPRPDARCPPTLVRLFCRLPGSDTPAYLDNLPASYGFDPLGLGERVALDMQPIGGWRRARAPYDFSAAARQSVYRLA